MSSLFDFDNSQDLVFQAKTAGKQIISAKHEALTKLGAFIFLAHSDQEFALRCQMFDNDLTAIANRRLATVSDSKGKLVRALHAEWSMRHASCKCAGGMVTPAPNLTSKHDMGARSNTSTPTTSTTPNLADYTKKFNQDTTAGERANSDAGYDKGQGGLWNSIKGVGNSIKGIADNVAQDARTIGNDTLHALAPTVKSMMPGPLTGISNSISKGMENAGENTNGPGGTNVNQGLQNPFDLNKKSSQSKIAKDYDGDGKQESDAKEHAGVVHNAIQEEKGGKADGQDTTKIEASFKETYDNLKEAISSTTPENTSQTAVEGESVSEPAWQEKTRAIEANVACPSCQGAGCESCLSGTSTSMNTNTSAEAGSGMRTVPSMTASRIAHEGQNTDDFPSMIKHMTEDHGIEPLKGQSYESHTNPETIKGYHEQDHKHMTAGIKSSSSSCDCGEDSISNFNGKPSCLPGMGCQTGAQSGNCPGCGQSFHGFNVCPGGNCQSNPEQELMLKTIMKLKNEIKELMGNSNGESLETIMRHDKGHDDWHRSMGQEPCSSEEDCAAKTEEHKAMEHKSSKLKKKDKEDHYKYIKKQGDSWVITQKGTGKVLSHHDSKEDAISSFKAMMANKHGSKIAHHHDFDDENEHYSGNSITGLPLQLSGEDGNAFGILGRAQKALRRANLHNEHWNNYHTEATSGDYNKLLATTMKYFDVD